jgi:uncharacterized membrane protein YagU involved in acid resistance
MTKLFVDIKGWENINSHIWVQPSWNLVGVDIVLGGQACHMFVGHWLIEESWQKCIIYVLVCKLWSDVKVIDGAERGMVLWMLSEIDLFVRTVFM